MCVMQKSGAGTNAGAAVYFVCLTRGLSVCLTRGLECVSHVGECASHTWAGVRHTLSRV